MSAAALVRETGVAGFLESQGEFLRSVDVMQGLLREYPPEAYVAQATYALAQRVYAKAPEAATVSPGKRVPSLAITAQRWSRYSTCTGFRSNRSPFC